MIDNNPLLQPSPLQINPVNEALGYIDVLGLSSFVPHAKVGLHIYCPYHCLTHELLVVYHALQAYFYEFGRSKLVDARRMEARYLALASLFHDHDHSGGKTLDVQNIKRAQVQISKIAPDLDTKHTVNNLIAKTEFTNGKFVHAPTTFIERCLRDADLCMIYTNEGRKLLMELPREIDGGPSLYRRGIKERTEWFAKNRAFLESCEMFTEYGQLMKEFHLERACQDFEDLVNYAVSANYIASNSKCISAEL